MDKKAQSTAELVFWFAFLYLPLTLAVSFAVVKLPKSLVEQSLQPASFDLAIETEQLKSQLWETNSITGSTSPFDYVSDFKSINRTSTQKILTYKVTLDGKESVYDATLYKKAEPIAPYKYAVQEQKQTVLVDGKQKELTIAAYAPYKYETK